MVDEKTKKHINIVIAFLLICTILITMLSAFVRFSLANKQVYLNLLESTNSYSVVTEALYKKMNAILGNDIGEDLKKSIITEEDVRKEANVVLDCMISNLIIGQAVIPEIDTNVYKERIVDALNSLTGYDVYLNKRKNLTSYQIINKYTIEPMNLIVKNNSNVNNINLKVDNSNSISNDLLFENLATRAELEARARAILKEKGITEAEARAKLAEKGISEEQLWQYAKDHGYLDEENESNEKLQTPTDSNEGETESTIKQNNAGENSINSSDDSTKANSQSSGDAGDSKISKNKIQNIVMSIILDKSMSFDEKMDKVYLELMNEAEIIINKEMSNLNCSKLINSNMFVYAVKITSILYKLFYIDLLILLILIVVLAIINNFNFINIINYLSKSIIISGMLSTIVFGFIYLSKVYTRFSGMIGKSYFQPIFLASSEYFCRILFIVSVGIFIVGLIMNILTIKKRLIGR